MLLVVASLAALAAAPSLEHGLVWDDLHFLDPHRGVLWRPGWLRATWTELMWAGGRTDSIPPYYRPLGLTLLRLEGSPSVSHLVQVGLHILNTVLVARLAAAWGAGRVQVVLGASLFAVHPAQVEVYSWLSARGDALGTTFALLALLVVSRSPQSLWRRAAFGVLVLLALLTKETFVVLPFVAAIHERSLGPLRSAALPVLLWGVLYAAALTSAGGGSGDIHLDLRFLGHGLLLVPFLLFAPTGRTAGYLPGVLPAHWIVVWVALVTAYVYVAWSASTRRGRRDLAAVAVSITPALVPLLMLGGRSGDRYVYFTLALLLAGAAARLRLPETLRRRSLVIVVSAALIASGVVAARAQSKLWGDPQLRLLRPAGPKPVRGSEARDPQDVVAQGVELAVREDAAVLRHLDYLLLGELACDRVGPQPLRQAVQDPLPEFALRQNELVEVGAPPPRDVSLE